MLYLFEYNRNGGDTISLRVFDDSQREAAWDAKLEMELSLNHKGIDHDVTLLEAQSEDMLRWTHGRYFGTFHQILQSGRG